MGGTGGIITGQWAPSAFALFMVQVLLIVALSRVYSQVLKYVRPRHAANRTHAPVAHVCVGRARCCVRRVANGGVPRDGAWVYCS